MDSFINIIKEKTTGELLDIYNYHYHEYQETFVDLCGEELRRRGVNIASNTIDLSEELKTSIQDDIKDRLYNGENSIDIIQDFCHSGYKKDDIKELLKLVKLPAAISKTKDALTESICELLLELFIILGLIFVAFIMHLISPSGKSFFLDLPILIISMAVAAYTIKSLFKLIWYSIKNKIIMWKFKHTRVLKSAIIMGATSGIGYEVAKLLAQRGWKVGVAGRREEILSRLVKETEGIVAYEVIDVTAPHATEALHRLIKKMGKIDLYFHSSGIGYKNIQLNEDKELETIETNCLGMARLVGEIFRYFERHEEIYGQIAVISSIAGAKGLGASPAYSSSKRFTSHYLECLCQLISIKKIHNIHISDIRPGFVRTPLIESSNFPMQLDAKKVARNIVSALIHRKSVVTINWFYRIVVFFWKMIPRRIWVKLRIK